MKKYRLQEIYQVGAIMCNAHPYQVTFEEHILAISCLYVRMLCTSARNTCLLGVYSRCLQRFYVKLVPSQIDSSYVSRPYVHRLYDLKNLIIMRKAGRLLAH